MIIARLYLAFFLVGAVFSQSEPSTCDSEPRPIFNGCSLDGWDAPEGSWQVKNAAMETVGGKGSIVYEAKTIPDNFELSFEWKVARGSNSGVYYGIGEYEYQIVDNATSDGKSPLTSAAALYNFAPATKDVTKPVGEWNAGRIRREGTTIQHWLNGELVVDVDYSLARWREAIERHKKFGGDITSRGGHFFFQDHGTPVWFRNIKLRELCSQK